MLRGCWEHPEHLELISFSVIYSLPSASPLSCSDVSQETFQQSPQIQLPFAVVAAAIVESLSRVWLCDPMDSAHQASLPYTISRSCSNSCPLGQWCRPTISSSAVPFSIYLTHSNSLHIAIAWSPRMLCHFESLIVEENLQKYEMIQPPHMLNIFIIKRDVL